MPIIKQQLKKEEYSDEPIFPEINSSIAEFDALIVWHVGANNERIPEPFEGIDPEYDQAKKKVATISKKLD